MIRFSLLFRSDNRSSCNYNFDFRGHSCLRLSLFVEDSVEVEGVLCNMIAECVVEHKRRIA